MTDEQINEAIAEAHGWTEIQDSGVWHHHKLWGYSPLKPGQSEKLFDYLPNYCTDLNAMHEAETVLTEEQCAFFEAHLRNRPFNHPASFYMWHATARERAKAFLHALEKSKKVQK